MKILILGAGQVGTTLAENLVEEGNDVTIVDPSPEKLHLLLERLDIRTIVGHGAHPTTLMAAGIRDVDMLIAVTSSDETNMIACQVAYTLFNTPAKIARIRTSAYLDQSEIFGNRALPIDVCISPEQLVTQSVKRLIEHPGALQVLDFAAGRLQLVAVKPKLGAVLVGHPLSELSLYLPNVQLHVAAIYRANRSIPPGRDTVIERGDEVFFIAAPKDIPAIMIALGYQEKPYKRITIGGGGQYWWVFSENLRSGLCG